MTTRSTAGAQRGGLCASPEATPTIHELYSSGLVFVCVCVGNLINLQENGNVASQMDKFRAQFDWHLAINSKPMNGAGPHHHQVRESSKVGVL